MFGLSKPVAIGLAILFAVALITGVANCIRRDAARDERARIEAQLARDTAAQLERERQAEENRRNSENIAREAREQRQKEIDDATRNIPDQAPSDRQRRRACLELWREAKASGQPHPTC